MPVKKIKNILIVEDDRPIAKAPKLKLEKSGFAAEMCFDGEEAMVAMKKKKFDLILLDLMMPKKDGFSFLSEVKPKKLKIPIIVLSNLGQEEDLQKAKDLGAVGYFVKSNTPIADVISYVRKKLA